MISLKTLIVEGRYDSLVTKLSNTLLKIIKDSYAATKDINGYEYQGSFKDFRFQQQVLYVSFDGTEYTGNFNNSLWNGDKKMERLTMESPRMKSIMDTENTWLKRIVKVNI